MVGLGKCYMAPSAHGSGGAAAGDGEVAVATGCVVGMGERGGCSSRVIKHNLQQLHGAVAITSSIQDASP